MVYSTRVTPPDWHLDALSSFDDEVRYCFENFSGIHCDNLQWTKATLSTKHGGLGLREAKKHCYAGFLASTTSCSSKCNFVDENFIWDTSSQTSHVERALSDFNNLVLERDKIILNATDPKLKQGDLSEAIDKASVSLIINESNLLNEAHFKLENASKSGAWLNALPCESLGQQVPGVLFSLMLKRRLRKEIFSNSFHCPLCDQIMDVYADHALVCSAGGDRTSRHNSLRNKAYSFCEGAMLRPQLEKTGLLKNAALEKLRPADIFIPSLKAGQQAALDFGVTCGIKNDILNHSAKNDRYATEQYAEFKRNNLTMNNRCQQYDINYIPMIIEGSGGSWGSEAEDVWKIIIRTTASITGEAFSSIATRIYQSLSVTLHKANARAILKRMPAQKLADQVMEGASSIILEENT